MKQLLQFVFVIQKIWIVVKDEFNCNSNGFKVVMLLRGTFVNKLSTSREMRNVLLQYEQIGVRQQKGMNLQL